MQDNKTAKIWSFQLLAGIITLFVTFQAQAIENLFDDPPKGKMAFYTWLDEQVDIALARMGEDVIPVPRSILLSLARVESGCGRVKLALKRKNLFGIMTPEGKLRAFDNHAAGIASLLRTLSNNPRYAAFRSDLHRKSPEELVQHLRGYANDKQHAKKLAQFIRKDGLTAFDSDFRAWQERFMHPEEPLNSETVPLMLRMSDEIALE